MATTKERKRRKDLSPLEHWRLKRGSGGLTMALVQKMSILVWILMGSIFFDNLLSSESSKSAHPIAERSKRVPPFTLLPRAMAFNLWHNIEKLEQQATSKRSPTTTATPIIMPPPPTTRRKDEDGALSKSFDEACASWPPQEMQTNKEEEDILENSSSINHHKKNDALSSPSTESFLSFLSSLHKDGNERNSNEQQKITPTNTVGNDEIHSTIVIADDKVRKQQQEPEQTHEVSSDTTRDDESDKEDNLVVASFVARKKICTKPLPVTFLNAQQVVEIVDPTTLFLKEFFLKHRNLLFADGATIHEIDKPSDALWKVFDEEQEQHKQRRRQDNSKEDLLLMDQEQNHSTQVITKFLELSNPPMGFLGLQLISKVIVATQLFCFLEQQQKSSTTQKRLPEYQFTLVGSSFDARGPKPLVWVFNKIMKRKDNNNNKKKKDEEAAVENATTTTKPNGKKKKAMKTSGFTRVWAEEVSSTFSDDSAVSDTEKEMTTGEKDDSTTRTAKIHSKNTSTLLPMSSHNKIEMIGSTTKKKNGNLNDEATSSTTSPNPNNMIRFCTDATLVSDLVFPKLLVRILPVSLEKMEEEGSKAMQVAVEKDIIPAMERIQNAWYNCTEEQNV